MKNKIIILIGPPCSGKTKWSREYCLNTSSIIRINRDEMRTMVRGRLELHQLAEDIITAGVLCMIQRALDNHYDVIIDQRNCKFKYISAFYKRFKDHADIKLKVFNVPLAELKKRNQMRALETHTQPIKDDVIVRMFVWQQQLIQLEDFKRLLANSEDSE